jgi:acyl-CoA synthetase (NDP forming)
MSVAQALVEATRDRPELLPVYVSLTSGEPSAEIVEAMRAAGGIPVLRGAQEAFRAIAHRARWEARRAVRLADGPRRAGWPELALDRTSYGYDASLSLHSIRGAVLPERDSLELLRAAGLSVVEATAASDADAAVSAARSFGRPVVLKLDAPGLAHKSDVGGVRLGLAGDDAVRAAAQELLAVAKEASLDARGLLVQPMAQEGVELIVGARRDPLFGPVVLVGLGGTLAEVLDDVAIRLVPVRTAEADVMLDELRGAAILRGVRGRPALDRAAIASLVSGLGALLEARPDVVEIDLNPVVARPDGALAVDALVVLEVAS